MITEQQIIEAAKVIKNGGVVVYPTETAYGLGVDATNEGAVEKMYALKGRSCSKPTHICVRSIAEANLYAVVDDRARLLAKSFMPGPLTLVLPTRCALPPLMEESGGGSCGLRIPDNGVISRLMALSNRPITAPSANRQAGTTPYSVDEVRKSFGDDFSKIDYVLDAGELPRATPSTILSLMGPEPKILREGPISLAQIMKSL